MVLAACAALLWFELADILRSIAVAFLAYDDLVLVGPDGVNNATDWDEVRKLTDEHRPADLPIQPFPPVPP